jgi:hypothetical protein
LPPAAATSAETSGSLVRSTKPRKGTTRLAVCGRRESFARWRRSISCGTAIRIWPRPLNTRPVTAPPAVGAIGASSPDSRIHCAESCSNSSPLSGTFRPELANRHSSNAW